MLPQKLRDRDGFGLIELTVLIVIIGILAAVAMQSARMAVDSSREAETRNEMELLAQAIVGNPALMVGGQRSDFGYVGDIGAFPSNLQALLENPGGYSTWHGPYLPAGVTEDTTGFKYDAWGKLYGYTGALTITSTGSGSNIVQSLGRSIDDFLFNRVTGSVADSSGSAPGTVFADSVVVEIDIPNGTGGTTMRGGAVSEAGTFTLDSLPIGLHPVRAIYLPEADTLSRFVAILPRHRGTLVFRFPSVQFASGSTSSVTNTIVVSTDNSASLAGQPVEDEDLVAYDRVLMSASMYLDGDGVFADDEDIDAVHLDSVGSVVLSTAGAAQIGALSFDDDDLVRYNPLTGSASLVFDGSARFSTNENIDAVYVYPDGRLVISTGGPAQITGLNVGPGDLFGYDPGADTSWLLLDGSGLFTGTADIDAVHILDDGRIVFSCAAAAQIGSLAFDDEDLILYNPSNGQSVLFWDSDAPFGTPAEDVDALYIGHVTPPTGNLDTLVLRPDGTGSFADLPVDGCASNFECVDEITSDEDATRLVQSSNTYADDAYTLEDPAVSSGEIVGVRVLARCRCEQTQGAVKLLLMTAGTPYYSANQTLNATYAEQSEAWATNPATAAGWTWSDIAALQAGVSLRGQNVNFPAYCTQVWVEVVYVD